MYNTHIGNTLHINTIIADETSVDKRASFADDMIQTQRWVVHKLQHDHKWLWLVSCCNIFMWEDTGGQTGTVKGWYDVQLREYAEVTGNSWS